MNSEVRYCKTTDGIGIAYATSGDGPPLILVVGWINPFELSWKHSGTWCSFAAYERFFTLVRFDKRGIGLSDRDVDDFSIEARLRDLEAVIDALGFDEFALYGHSEGGTVAMTYAARHPERLTRLVIHASFGNGRTAFNPALVKPFAALIREHWGLGAAAMTEAFSPEPEDREWFTRMQREGAHREVAARYMEATAEIDVRDVLSFIKTPTLIVHGLSDQVTPFVNARDLAASISGAQLLSYEGDHFFTDAPRHASLQRRIAGFLLNRDISADEWARSDDPRARSVTTVLFTDIVGHTAMMQRLGDDHGRDVLREHERITRDLLNQHGGTEVKTMGDGFMASFGSVTRAMDCAIALQRAFAAHTDSTPEPLRVRVGLNAGEPIKEDGDLFGSTVILASRIAAKAEAGEILVPDAVRGLLSGKGFAFEYRGEFVPKGFDEAVRLWDVRWRE